MGTDFIEASEGKIALVELIREKPDIAIMDTDLPDINIPKILQALQYLGKEELLTIPIITIYKSASKKKLSQLKKLGIHDFLTKPLKTKSLVQTVKIAMFYKE